MSETIISEIREYLLGRFTMHADDMVRRLDMYVTENTAELAQLRTKLTLLEYMEEQTNINTMRLGETIVQLRAELDEATKLIKRLEALLNEDGLRNPPTLKDIFDARGWLSAHPEETK